MSQVGRRCKKTRQQRGRDRKVCAGAVAVAIMERRRGRPLYNGSGSLLVSDVARASRSLTTNAERCELSDVMSVAFRFTSSLSSALRLSLTTRERQKERKRDSQSCISRPKRFVSCRFATSLASRGAVGFVRLCICTPTQRQRLTLERA